ncbi:MAG: aminopeptidase P family protein, partial [Desulfobacterales bacterium]|nr:aminopeptidase P family protein [Desulfobacterales bacterium]
MEPRIQNRLQKLRQSFPEAGIDTLLVLIGENRRYVSGFTGEDTGFDESAGALLISEKANVLATDSRYEIQAQNEAPDFEVVCHKKGLSKELPGILDRLETTRLGYESRRMTCEQHEQISEQLKQQCPAVELVKTRNLGENLRVCKEETEIEAIRTSLHLAESAFSRFLEQLSSGMSEARAAWEIEKQMREAGAQSVSFPVISAFGTNAALPHAVPTERALQNSQPLLFDWGARLNGYCSDISRTIILGKPDEQFNRVFTAVYDAQQKAIAAVKPGAWTKDVDAAARDHLHDKGLDQYFGHGLGHGVGLAIHEAPSLSPMDERNVQLEENMIFTVEPGVYLPEWGGVRLENMVAVRPWGAEVLN